MLVSLTACLWKLGGGGCKAPHRQNSKGRGNSATVPSHPQNCSRKFQAPVCFLSYHRGRCLVPQRPMPRTTVITTTVTTAKNKSGKCGTAGVTIWPLGMNHCSKPVADLLLLHAEPLTQHPPQVAHFCPRRAPHKLLLWKGKCHRSSHGCSLPTTAWRYSKQCTIYNMKTT